MYACKLYSCVLCCEVFMCIYRENIYDPERSTMMLDNPAYASRKQCHIPSVLQSSTRLMNNPAYTCPTFKTFKPKPAALMSGNPAYSTVLEYNPTYFSADRLVLHLNHINQFLFLFLSCIAINVITCNNFIALRNERRLESSEENQYSEIYRHY